MYSTTATRRKPAGPYVLDSGVSARFMDSRNLWPMYTDLGPGVRASVVSRLHGRALSIILNDPDVIAVTAIEPEGSAEELWFYDRFGND